MPAQAMSLPGVLRGSKLPAPVILGLRHGFGVLWVHTSAIPTQMVRFKAIRDWSGTRIFRMTRCAR